MAEIISVSGVNYSNGSVRGEKTQTIEKGKDGSAVEAIPNFGYKFKQWSDGKTEALRQDKNVEGNITDFLTAISTGKLFRKALRPIRL